MYIDEIKSQIENNIKILTKNYSPVVYSGKKVIHDSIHGTNSFEPFELAFIGLPMVQRLRYVSQTDVAYMVYPGANHNRFEHSLGVAMIAKKMVNALYDNNPELEKIIKKDYIINHVSIAAILHDTGHGPFSHLSESVYKNYIKFDQLIEDNKELVGGNPHEILSYFISTSDYMANFNKEHIEKNYGIKLDMQLIAEMIVGYIDKNNPERRKMAFAVEIINGPFDADKLDYMARDSHATGLNLTLDIDRLLYTIDYTIKEDIVRLAIDIAGATSLEQIAINKMMLYSSIYHHQKVRASGCVVKSFIDKLIDKEGYASFIRSNDFDIYAELSRANNTFLDRQLPHRLISLCKRTIDNKEKLAEIFQWNGDEQQELIDIIVNKCEECGIDIRQDELWIDIPSPPRFKEAPNTLIKLYKNKSDCITLNDVFPSNEWAKAFSENKWQGFIFTSNGCVKEISDIAKEILKNQYGIKINIFSDEICKIS